MLTGRAKAYSSSYPQAVTHRSTNRARRRVTSCAYRENKSSGFVDSFMQIETLFHGYTEEVYFPYQSVIV